MSESALRISGRQGKFACINGKYEPMAEKHNGDTAWVARDFASRFLFHTGKNRWVISNKLDDGQHCWAYVSGGDKPWLGNGPWQCHSGDGWQEDKGITVQQEAPTNDMWTQLRAQIMKEMEKYGCPFCMDTPDSKSILKTLWKKLDYNGNGVVSLAEIDKLVVEKVAGGDWPEWMNNKPALMRAYKKTTLKDGDGDAWVEKKEFHALLLNMFWFNKLWGLFMSFNSHDGTDRRINKDEFIRNASAIGLNGSPQQLDEEFRKMDENGGGQVLFVEFCAYIRKMVNPDANPEFDADIVSGEHCGRASYNTVNHGHMHSGHHSHHSSPMMHTRDLNFSQMSQSPMGSGYPQAQSTHSRAEGKPMSEVHNTLRSTGQNTTREHYVHKKTFAEFDELEARMKADCRDRAKCKRMWSTLDFNGNGVVSLAEIDKFVVENYPLLNHKPALMRCYKCTMERKDEFLHRRDFKRFILNVFYFNKLYWLFDQCNGDDRRMTKPEFKDMLSMLKVNSVNADQEFSKMDKNGGGMVLFDEFCHWFAQRSCPDVINSMDDLEESEALAKQRQQYDGTEKALSYASQTQMQGTMHW